jgi:hypothetical protein
VHNGKTNRLTSVLILRLVSAASIVTGKVPDDDFEKKATESAGAMALNVLIGSIFFEINHSGRIIVPWTILASIIIIKYCPILPIFIPLLNSIILTVINPNNPIGRILTRNFVIVKNILCIPLKKEITEFLAFSSRMNRMANPKMTLINKTLNTLCSENDEKMLSGIISKKYLIYPCASFTT